MRKGSEKPQRIGAPIIRRVATVDIDTGEVLQGVPMIASRPPTIGRDWFMGMQERLVQLAMDSDLQGETWRVLAYLLGRMDWENWLRLSQKDVGEALGMKRQNVQRALRVLLEKEVIEKSGTTVGSANLYRMSKQVAWRGKARNWHSAKKGEQPAQTHLRLVQSETASPGK